jgi:hypothetical protein
MNLPEDESGRRLGWAVALTFAVLCVLLAFVLLAVRAGEPVTSVGGVAALLCGAAGAVAVRVVRGGRAGQWPISRGPSAATEDPHPGTGEPLERQDRGAL